MEYLVAVITGYLFGSINMAYIISKSQGVNIKAIGSKNAGASNVFISVGKMFGVAVGAFDVLKAFCAAQLVAFIFPNVFDAAVLAGAMAIVGHIFPFWMKFSGGKGLAPFMGTVLFVDWRIFLIFSVLIAAITLITDYIAIGTLVVSLIMPIYAVIAEYSSVSVIIFASLAVLIWIKHTDNIKRLLKGEEVGMRGKNKKKAEK
ncbi:MAG: glycerol-3-phosphate acyltransferase [Oscillospiraceae bacterium]